MFKRTARAAIAIGLIAATAMVFQPAGAAIKLKWYSVSQRYDAPGGTWQRTSRTDPTCAGDDLKTCQVANDGRIDVGGIRFDPVGGKGTPSKLLMTVEFTDDVNAWGKVSVQVCENVDLNNSCFDEADRNYKNACLAPGQRLTLRDVSRKSQILVFVRAMYSCTQYVNDVPDDQGSSTSGVVKLRYKDRA